MLQGVEVVAYGTQKKVTITGAISSVKGELQFEGALSYEGCRLSPGTEKNPYGQITVAHDLTINQAIYVAYRPFWWIKDDEDMLFLIYLGN